MDENSPEAPEKNIHVFIEKHVIISVLPFSLLSQFHELFAFFEKLFGPSLVKMILKK
jgi:hypothetical protein